MMPIVHVFLNIVTLARVHRSSRPTGPHVSIGIFLLSLNSTLTDFTETLKPAFSGKIGFN